MRDIDTGQPLSDVSVNLHQTGRDSWERRMDSPWSPYRGVTGATGRIVLDGLVPGTYRVYASHREYKLVEEKLELAVTVADPPELAFEIGLARRTGGKLAGTIENARGRDSVHHRIALVSLDDPTIKSLEAIVDFDGTFEARDIPPGTYEVHFRENVPTEKGEETRTRTGSISLEDTVEKSTVLGTVQIVEGVTAELNYTLEREAGR